MHKVGAYKPSILLNSNNNQSVNKENGIVTLDERALKAKYKDAKESQKNNITNRPIQGLNKLSPIRQYEYMKNFGTSKNNTFSLKEIPGDPEGTIRRANQVINSAITHPMVSNPGRDLLDRAIQLKRSMLEKIDKAA